MTDPVDTSDLWDYRRRVGATYVAARAGGAGEEPWKRWRQERDRLFAHHPQSPLDAAQKVTFTGIPYFPYDPAWRFEVELAVVEADDTELGHNAGGSTIFRKFATAGFHAGGAVVKLSLYWLLGYAGGVFVPFGDATNGSDTYGGGRYLLDTAKGADLGSVGSRVVFDFNYSYHPSCVHNPRWSCPLPPPENRVSIPILAGERLGPGMRH